LDIVRRFDRLGWRNKQWTTHDSKQYGGSPLRRGHIYKMLANVAYSGRLRVGAEIVAGEHKAIIDQQTFDLVQARLKQTAVTPGAPRGKTDALLRGFLYCASCGAGMYSTYSASKERRYRYYLCYQAQQKLEGSCGARSVSAPAVEDAVVESISRVGVHPDVLAETARVARQRLAEALAGKRAELSAANARAKNLKSQLARARNAESARTAEIQGQIATAEAQAVGLRSEMQGLERRRIDEKEMRSAMESFEEVWKIMNLDEQRALLGQLVEKVGYDSLSGKVTVSFKSANIKALCK
jgi:site-specific DNA recombinase